MPYGNFWWDQLYEKELDIIQRACTLVPECKPQDYVEQVVMRMLLWKQHQMHIRGLCGQPPWPMSVLSQIVHGLLKVASY